MDSESLEGFESLLKSYLEEFDPKTPTETSLVETMAIARWRYLRVCHMQRATLDLEMARQESSAAPSFALLATTHTRSISCYVMKLLSNASSPALCEPCCNFKRGPKEGPILISTRPFPSPGLIRRRLRR